MKIERFPTKEEIRKYRIRRAIDTAEVICKSVGASLIMVGLLFAFRGIGFCVVNEVEFFNDYSVRGFVMTAIGVLFAAM